MRFIVASVICILFFSSSYAQAGDVISKIRSAYKEINENTNSFSKREKEDSGQSADGGTATAYYKGKSLQFITAVYMGESGKQRSEYYFKDAKLIFVVEVHFAYNRPYYYDQKAAKENNDTAWFDSKKTKIAIGRYYFDKEKLIQWVSDGRDDNPFDLTTQVSTEKRLLYAAERLKKMFENS